MKHEALQNSEHFFKWDLADLYTSIPFPRKTAPSPCRDHNRLLPSHLDGIIPDLARRTTALTGREERELSLLSRFFRIFRKDSSIPLIHVHLYPLFSSTLETEDLITDATYLPIAAFC